MRINNNNNIASMTLFIYALLLFHVYNNFYSHVLIM